MDQKLSFFFDLMTFQKTLRILYTFHINLKIDVSISLVGLHESF